MDRQNNKILGAIIRTLAYAEIFDYPMTDTEIHKYLITKKKIPLLQIQEVLLSSNLIEHLDGYYALRDIEQLVNIRRTRATHSRRKLARAFFIANILTLIPTIKLIGISGSLSMMNAGVHDDIDLFFITRKNSLWMSRFFVTVILYFLKQKRKRGVPHAANKICPNMFIASDNLSFRKKQQNLYIAHEITQLKILYDRGNTHAQFLSQNTWISQFLPHGGNMPARKKSGKHNAFLLPVLWIEKCFYVAQRTYMKKHKTIEEIGPARAGFHPIDRNNGIQEMYALKCTYYLGKLGKVKNASERQIAVN